MTYREAQLCQADLNFSYLRRTLTDLKFPATNTQQSLRLNDSNLKASS